MKIIKFELTSNGVYLGQTPVREQAIGFAKLYANKNNTDVSVVGFTNDGRYIKVIVKANGDIDKVWKHKNEI